MPVRPASAGAAAADAPERRRDAERTRAEILEVATAEFARHGYSGARVDEIAALTRTTKRMLYYYFGSKKQLYVTVLENAYARIRAAEQQVDVADLDPIAAVRHVAGITFDHHEAHPDFIRLVSIENVHRAEHITELASLAELNSPAIRLLEQILRQGRAQGLFRDDVDAVDLHMMISAFCFFRVSNRYTFGAIFGRDMLDPARREHYRATLADMIVSHLTHT